MRAQGDHDGEEASKQQRDQAHGALTGGPLTFGKMLQAVRDGDELTLEVFAKRIGVSRQSLCDIEKGRKGVSPERAARWARLLGYPEAHGCGQRCRRSSTRRG